MSHECDVMLSVRWARRAERQAELRGRQPLCRAPRRFQAGQTLIIFALTFTTLLGMSGLVVDVARAYDLYGKMQRAAEAGAFVAALCRICWATSPPRSPAAWVSLHAGASTVARPRNHRFPAGDWPICAIDGANSLPNSRFSSTLASALTHG